MKAQTYKRCLWLLSALGLAEIYWLARLIAHSNLGDAIACGIVLMLTLACLGRVIYRLMFPDDWPEPRYYRDIPRDRRI